MENSMWTLRKWKLKKKLVINFHLLTESQRLPNMLGQRLYNMLGQRLYNMLGQRLYNTLGQHFLDEQSEDGFASRNQRWPNENCSLKPNVGPTSTCYLGYRCIEREKDNFKSSEVKRLKECALALIMLCLFTMAVWASLFMSVCPSVCLSVHLWKSGFHFLWHTMLIIHTCIAHNWRKTPIDFGVKRSRSNLYFEICIISAR